MESEQEEWRQRAACRGVVPVDFFYGDRLGRVKFFEPSTKAMVIRTLCENCPVKMDCVDHAITNNEQYGIWGGDE